MKRYEYKIKSWILAGFDADRVDRECNELGLEGWVLISFQTVQAREWFTIAAFGRELKLQQTGAAVSAKL